MNNETQSNLPLDHKRMWIIYILIGAVFLVYTGRLFNLQVVKGAEYLARAEETAPMSLTSQPNGELSMIATGSSWHAMCHLTMSP
jgi:cell division protein FtsI/penicillin-binding protein 2